MVKSDVSRGWERSIVRSGAMISLSRAIVTETFIRLVAIRMISNSQLIVIVI